MDHREPTIRVFYSCQSCGVKKIGVEVIARSPAQDLGTWMDHLVLDLSRHHRQQHPDCQSRVLRDVMIPMVGTTRVGGPAIQ